MTASLDYPQVRSHPTRFGCQESPQRHLIQEVRRQTEMMSLYLNVLHIFDELAQQFVYYVYGSKNKKQDKNTLTQQEFNIPTKGFFMK